MTTTGSEPANYGFAYDPADRMTQMVSTVDGTNNFTMDAADELQGASLFGETYQYDQNGNRQTANGATYQTGGDNRLLFDGYYTYLYDGEGNCTRRGGIVRRAAAERADVAFAGRGRQSRREKNATTPP